MFLANPPKALVAIVALICVTTLMALDSIDAAGGTGLLGLLTGYAIGNGIAARSGVPVEPIVGPNRRAVKK